jgi:hypothetical protein
MSILLFAEDVESGAEMSRAFGSFEELAEYLQGGWPLAGSNVQLVVGR